jgi:hypothetical protein
MLSFEYYWMFLTMLSLDGHALAGWFDRAAKHGNIPVPDMPVIMNGNSGKIDALFQPN